MKTCTHLPPIPSRLRVVKTDTPAEAAMRLAQAWEDAASRHGCEGNMALLVASHNVSEHYARTARLLANLDASITSN
jgi:hypothetical protein